MVLSVRWGCGFDFRGELDSEFGFGAVEDFTGILGQLDVPAARGGLQDGEGFAGAEPAFGDLFKVLEAVHDIPLSVLLGQVKQVDGAC